MSKPIPFPVSSKLASLTPHPVKLVSYLLAALLCLGTLVYGLLPGLLAVCLGFLLARLVAGQGRTKVGGFKSEVQPTDYAVVVAP